MRTAEVLERSAGLAEEHAQQCEKVGRRDRAFEEHQAAERALDGAQRARSKAAKLEQIRRELDLRERRADERERVADERERLADERERIADDRERAADELEARLADDSALASGPVPDGSQDALREAHNTLQKSRARVDHLAAEREAREQRRTPEP